MLYVEPTERKRQQPYEGGDPKAGDHPVARP
jgi:hypothetical protein